MEGPQAGAVLEKKGVGPFRLGRTTKSHFAVKDPSVSEKHAELAFKEGRWVIRDLGSSNGTKLNGEMVERKGD